MEEKRFKRNWNVTEGQERIGIFWSKDEENKMLNMISEGKSKGEISRILKRTEVAIDLRLKKIAASLFTKGTDIYKIERLTTINKDDIETELSKEKEKKTMMQKEKEFEPQSDVDIYKILTEIMVTQQEIVRSLNYQRKKIDELYEKLEL